MDAQDIILFNNRLSLRKCMLKAVLISQKEKTELKG